MMATPPGVAILGTAALGIGIAYLEFMGRMPGSGWLEGLNSVSGTIAEAALDNAAATGAMYAASFVAWQLGGLRLGYTPPAVIFKTVARLASIWLAYEGLKQTFTGASDAHNRYISAWNEASVHANNAGMYNVISSQVDAVEVMLTNAGVDPSMAQYVVDQVTQNIDTAWPAYSGGSHMNYIHASVDAIQNYRNATNLLTVFSTVAHKSLSETVDLFDNLGMHERIMLEPLVFDINQSVLEAMTAREVKMFESLNRFRNADSRLIQASVLDMIGNPMYASYTWATLKKPTNQWHNDDFEMFWAITLSGLNQYSAKTLSTFRDEACVAFDTEGSENMVKALMMRQFMAGYMQKSDNTEVARKVGAVYVINDPFFISVIKPMIERNARTENSDLNNRLMAPGTANVVTALQMTDQHTIHNAAMAIATGATQLLQASPLATVIAHGVAHAMTAPREAPEIDASEFVDSRKTFADALRDYEYVHDKASSETKLELAEKTGFPYTDRPGVKEALDTFFNNPSGGGWLFSLTNKEALIQAMERELQADLTNRASNDIVGRFNNEWALSADPNATRYIDVSDYDLYESSRMIMGKSNVGWAMTQAMQETKDEFYHETKLSKHAPFPPPDSFKLTDRAKSLLQKYETIKNLHKRYYEMANMDTGYGFNPRKQNNAIRHMVDKIYEELK